MRLMPLIAALAACAASINLAYSSPVRDARAGATSLRCSVRQLGQLLAVDSAKLVRGAESKIDVQNAEGAVGRAYFDGPTAKLFVAIYAGEGGRVEERYFLGDSLDFVVEREEIYYDRTSGDEPQRIRSRIPSVYYFCAGKQVHPADEAGTVKDLLRVRDHVVRRASASRPGA